MSDLAIKVEGLGKKYIINHETGNSDDNFREVIINNTKKALSIFNPFAKKSKEKNPNGKEDFWALRDLNFEIKKGEKVGIIGRNGAGKSTLLKVLSKITDPTAGKISINGRIASLLEVGTGFHPELTGRENIFLNGAVLGMSRKEIKQKFDEIVAFAEVKKFLDTPVKRYSSGMYVRLAFSVAAHLESEILVVDEVLAVGDVEFQKKCLGKMEDISKEGRTILFVSHNMNAIEQLCQDVIILGDGNFVEKLPANEGVNRYLKLFNHSASTIQLDEIPRKAPFGSSVKVVDGSLKDDKGNKVSIYQLEEKILLQLTLKVNENLTASDIHCNVSILNNQNLLITTVSSRTSYGFITCNKGMVQLSIDFTTLSLSPGDFYFNIAVGRKGHAPFDFIKNILPFSVLDTAIEQVEPHPNFSGIINTKSIWNVDYEL
ncbi:MAG: ABC transporter ATP-binding protein [SAR324 cluster bacterium]|nr:ABC transporter ATP-binding protein [SAR324 cluster bacterium]